MGGLDFVFPAIIAVILLVLFREIERWLHQHIFKVGWLLTHNFRITTIFYYIFFLPGVLLHEGLYWLMASILNIRAKGHFWPDEQDVGMLRLNFVELDHNAGVFKRAFIGITPLIAGMGIIWVIANNIIQIDLVLESVNKGNLNDISAGIRQLLGVPDIWLWIYIIFVLSNTMFPKNRQDIQGWKTIGWGALVILLLLFVLGLGNQLLGSVAPTLTQFFNMLQVILLIIIGINLVITLILGFIEASIEKVTGHSAMFRNGKLIAMTREEVKLEKEKQRKREEQKQKRQKTIQYKSIYDFVLPIPDGPGDEAVSQDSLFILEDKKEAVAGLPSGVNPRLGAREIDLSEKVSSPRTPKSSSAPILKPPTQVISSGAKPSVVESANQADPAAKPEEKASDRPSFIKSSSSPAAKSESPEKPASGRTSFSAPVDNKAKFGGRDDDFEDDDDDDDIVYEDIDIDIDDVEDEGVKSASPFGSKASPLLGMGRSVSPSSSKAFTVDDDDDEEEDEDEEEEDVKSASPFASKASPFSGMGRSVSPSSSKAFTVDDDDDEEDEDVKSASSFASKASPFSGMGRSSASPSTSKAFTVDDDEDEDEDEETGSVTLPGSVKRFNPSASPRTSSTTPISPFSDSAPKRDFGLPKSDPTAPKRESGGRPGLSDQGSSISGGLRNRISPPPAGKSSSSGLPTKPAAKPFGDRSTTNPWSKSAAKDDPDDEDDDDIIYEDIDDEA